MDPKYLNRDELVYELRVRGLPTVLRVPIVFLRAELVRRMADEEFGELPNRPQEPLVVVDEVNICTGKLAVLQKQIADFNGDHKSRDHDAIDTRMNHLLSRLARVEECGDEEQKASVQQLFSALEGEEEKILQKVEDWEKTAWPSRTIKSGVLPPNPVPGKSTSVSDKESQDDEEKKDEVDDNDCNVKDTDNAYSGQDMDDNLKQEDEVKFDVTDDDKDDVTDNEYGIFDGFCDDDRIENKDVMFGICDDDSGNDMSDYEKNKYDDFAKDKFYDEEMNYDGNKYERWTERRYYEWVSIINSAYLLQTVLFGRSSDHRYRCRRKRLRR